MIDGLTKDEMSKEQLEEYIIRLREELDREREERNYFQLERDKVNALWDITERKLKEAKAELKNQDKELEETEINLQVEIKVYRQKMRHLLCEHQNTICELDADRLASKDALQAKQTILEDGLRENMASHLVDIHQVDIEMPITELKKKHKEEVAALIQVSETKLKDTEDKNEKMLGKLQVDLENKMKTEVSEVRDNWNRFISTLMEKDREAFEDAKAFIKGTEERFDVNSSQTKKVAEEWTSLRKKEKELTQVLQENQQLTENLSKVQEEINQLQNKMKYPPRKFDNKKEIELNNLKSENELLQKKFKELQVETNELRRTSTESIKNMQNKADAKQMQMEKRIQEMTNKIQKDLLFS